MRFGAVAGERRQDSACCPYMDLPIIADRAAFEGASKGTIRTAFCTWIDSRLVECDEPGADTIDKDRTPRYHFYIYADEETITSAYTAILSPKRRAGTAGSPDDDTKYEDLESPDENELADMVNGLYTYVEWRHMQEHLQDEANYTPIDGVSLKDVGWLYAERGAPLYSYLFKDTAAWYQYYRRPLTTYADGRPKEYSLKSF